ncbi:uncharacterized protein LOC119298703 isoform X3 [Triticum dicoccoides]|uniref:uncharacterized protein LOC119298703 isoform X3 n=1 Tax=Triticum dicoccoides TaxID=85692 RepID=UPI00188DF1E7|nr:uncharacterized protein LOC119298703 isoform X3 [Triticum dicoccoides]
MYVSTGWVGLGCLGTGIFKWWQIVTKIHTRLITTRTQSKKIVSIYEEEEHMCIVEDTIRNKMPARKVMGVLLFLALLWSSHLVMVAEAAEDILPSDELSLEVLALLEDIMKSNLCPAACVTCLVQVGKSCPLILMMFAPCVLDAGRLSRLH